MIPDDELVTADRARLRELYLQRGIVPAREGFGCPNLPCCSEAAKLKLITGTWAYVGTAYGQARVGGRAVRILFVAMDRGGYEGPELETMAAAQCAFRSATETPGNAHMGGVHLLLRELIDDKDPAVFSRQYALTNAVKCARATETMATGARATMARKCASHLEREIDTLRPTVIITQGGHPAWTVKSLFAAMELIARFRGDTRGVAEVFRTQDRILLTTPHPARLKGLKWKQGVIPSFLCEGLASVRGELGKLG